MDLMMTLMQKLEALEEEKKPGKFGLDRTYRRKNRTANSRISARNICSSDPKEEPPQEDMEEDEE
jgi:hypothetical protein